MIFLVFHFETALFGEALPDFERFFQIDVAPLFTELLPYVYKRISLDVRVEGLELRHQRCFIHVLVHFLNQFLMV